MGDEIKTHKDLMIWQRSVELVTWVYRITNDYPKSEIYCLTNQIRRAVISIPSNIAEGAGRKSTKELIQFLYIALGSISELETQFIISKNLNYINQTQFTQLCNELQELIRMTTALIRKLNVK